MSVNRNRNKVLKRRQMLQDNFNPRAVESPSMVCRYAHTIYKIWKEGGSETVFQFLVDYIDIPEMHARMIADAYSPEKPPTEICPQATIVKGNFRDVFHLLELELPSRSSENGVWPKNLLAWYIMRSVFGADAFDFNVVGETGLNNDNRILFPKYVHGVNGEVLPFGVLALDAVNIGDLPVSILKKAELLINELGELGLQFARMLHEANFLFPPRKVLRVIIEAIQRGIAGERVLITGVFCPDYAYEATGRLDTPYRYTFSSVGSGVGLVAKQFVRVIPYLAKFFSNNGIAFDVRLGIADFECTPEVLSSVDVTKNVFIARCMESNEAMRRALSDYDVDLVLFEREWAGERFRWYTTDALRTMRQGGFGGIKSNTGKEPRREITFIAADGAKFYRRWYRNNNLTLREIEGIVIAQGAEYAAATRIMAEDYVDRPVIQIAGDRPKMQCFNGFYSDIPTLVTQRVY